MSKYRVDACFEMMGAFWKYGKDDTKFTGTLSSRRGLVEILTAPAYLNLDESASGGILPDLTHTSLEQVESLCGFTTDNECTLLNSVILDGGGLTSFPSRQKISRQRLQAMRTVMGLHVESSEAKTIDGAAYYFTKVHRLMPTPWRSEMSGMAMVHSVPLASTDVFKFTSETLQADVECEVFVGGGVSMGKGVKISSVPRIKITSKTPQSVDWYTSIAFRLENFYSLFLGTSVSLKHVQLFRGEEVGWVVQRIRRRREKVNLQTWIRCTFQETADALMKWLAVPLDQQLVELNMLSIMRKSNVFSETEFLTLAQTLEGFGRIRFGGERPREAKFNKLIEKTYDMLSADFAMKVVGERSAFVQQIIQTRDYYTHLGNAKGKSAANTMKELFLLNNRLHAFLRCVMLLDIGVSEKYVEQPILYQATRWR